ncbi:MAG: sigma-70 family RNA polymerase sigma factor [Actinomycetota bacterium]
MSPSRPAAPAAPRDAAPTPEERRLVAALRAGDEAAFMALVERYNGALLRLALSFVPSRAVAEEVVQETWLAVIQGIGRFEGRSTLRTWLFRILVNRAKTRGERERRTVPFSALAAAEADADETLVDPDRFLPHGHRWAGHWSQGPRPWGDSPEDRLLARETASVVTGAIDRLPPGQRAVVSLRDVAGWSAEEVCEALGISEVNQRVLLHRGRTRVRDALDAHLGEDA